MDADNRIRHLQALQSENEALRRHLVAHQQKLAGHHESRERDRALLAAKKAIRTAEQVQRRIERAIRNESKRTGL